MHTRLTLEKHTCTVMYVHVHSNPYNYINHSVRMVLGMFDYYYLCYTYTCAHTQ